MIQKLEKRAAKADKNTKTPSSARHALKKRVTSTPSTTAPPQNAPRWAINSGSESSATGNGSGHGLVESEGALQNDPEQRTTPAGSTRSMPPKRLANVIQSLEESEIDTSSSPSDSDSN